MMSGADALRGLLFLFALQAQKAIQEWTHQCHSTQLKLQGQSDPFNQ